MSKKQDRERLSNLKIRSARMRRNGDFIKTLTRLQILNADEAVNLFSALRDQFDTNNNIDTISLR